MLTRMASLQHVATMQLAMRMPATLCLQYAPAHCCVAVDSAHLQV